MMYSSGFAPYYDTLNADNDPERWVSYLQRLFASRGKKPESVVDLACGTGALTVHLHIPISRFERLIVSVCLNERDSNRFNS